MIIINGLDGISQNKKIKFMNSLGVLKAISDFFTAASGAEIAILIFIFLNILITIFNAWTQFRLKAKDKELIGFKMREEKKVKIYEELFSYMQELNYLNPENDKEEYLEKVTLLEKKTEMDKLYITGKTSKVISKFCDYCKVVLTDYRKKDLKKEEKMVDEFKKLFNK